MKFEHFGFHKVLKLLTHVHFLINTCKKCYVHVFEKLKILECYCFA